MHRQQIIIIALAAAVTLTSGAAAQTTYYVDGTCGDDTWAGTNPNCVAPNGPKATIQAAINAAAADDQILVHPGVYVERTDLLDKTITLRSTHGPEVTIINGGASGTVITCTGGQGPDMLIQGFTICDGGVGYGAGMRNQGSSPTIRDCVFTGNNADQGAAMYNMDNSDPTLINCAFHDNWTYSEGGAMYNTNNSNPTLINCVFSRNWSYYEGSGIYNQNNSSPTLINCVFSENGTDRDGGGLFNIYSSNPTLINCTFTANSATDTGGGMSSDITSAPTVSNCIFWDNTAPEGPQIFNEDGGATTATYSCIEGGWPGIGNIDADPCLDRMLHPVFRSPCIDAGNNAAVPPDVADLDGDGDTAESCPLDLDGRVRFFDDPVTPDTGAGVPPIVDMGACEYGPQPKRADLDGDGDVDMDDFNLFQQQFTGPQP